MRIKKEIELVKDELNALKRDTLTAPHELVVCFFGDVEAIRINSNSKIFISISDGFLTVFTEDSGDHGFSSSIVSSWSVTKKSSEP